jgi:hypothetical protein
MDFSDDRWSGLMGGYRQPYDPRPALKAIDGDQNAEAAWSELWEELHHQSDVDIASYAALPWIAHLAAKGKAGGWNAYALAATIEEARSNSRNPPIPEWLVASYAQGWSQLCTAALNLLRDAEDPLVVRSVLAVVAIHKRLPVLGRLAASFSEEELLELLTEAGWA